MVSTNSTTVNRVTWGTLCSLEPRLRAIAAEAAQCNSESNYPYFKRRIEQLVGWYAAPDADPTLQTTHAYSIACRAIYDLIGAASRSRGGRS